MNAKTDTRRYMLLSALMLSSCATQQQVYLPDGSVGTQVACSGEFMSWSVCHASAGKICGTQGYTTVREDESADCKQPAKGFLVWAVPRVCVRVLTFRCGK